MFEGDSKIKNYGRLNFDFIIPIVNFIFGNMSKHLFVLEIA